MVELITRPEECYPMLSSVNVNLYTFKLVEEVKQTNKRRTNKLSTKKLHLSISRLPLLRTYADYLSYMNLQGASVNTIALLIVNNANIPLQYQFMVLKLKCTLE